MGLKIVGVGGEPATGKTTLFKKLMQHFGIGKSFKFGLCGGSFHHEAQVIVIGLYDESLFSGTDRLSMQVQASAEKFMAWVMGQPEYDGWTIYFEGDRLFAPNFLTFVKGLGLECHWFILDCPPAELKRRHGVRGDGQNETWLKGRQTKIENIAKSHPVSRLPNVTLEDRAAAIETILAATGQPMKLQNP